MFGPLMAAPHTLRAARDERRIVRLAAIAVLAAAPDDDTASVLQRVAATDNEFDIRRTAVQALSDVARRQGPVGDEAVQMLVAMLTDGERGQEAAAALARLPVDRLASVAGHLHHPDATIRRAIVDMLGRSRHSEATTLLVDALNDKAAAVRDAATLALGRRRHV